MSVEQSCSLTPDQENIALKQLLACAEWGLSLDQMRINPLVTNELRRYDILTTVEPRFYKTPKEYRQALEHQQALDQIAGHLERVAANTNPNLRYQANKGTLGTYFKNALWRVTAVHGDDVDVKDRTYDGHQLVDGTVFARSMKFSVSSADDVGPLHEFFQIALRAPDRAYLLHPYSKGNEHHVIVDNLDEHAIRAMERDEGALLAKEDRRLGFSLPPNKDRLQGWLDNGETFPTFKEWQLREAVQAYRQLEQSDNITATYSKQYGHLVPWMGKDILGPCPAPALQAARSIMNGFIREVFPMGSERNQEQHPDYPFEAEAGIIFRRYAFRQSDGSPPASRLLTDKEKFDMTRRSMIIAMKARPVGLFIASLAKIAGAGVPSLAEIGVATAPATRRAIDRQVSQYRNWREYQRALDESDGRIKSALRDLVARQVLAYPQKRGPSIILAHV